MAKLPRCPRCDNPFDGGARFCPACEVELNTPIYMPAPRLELMKDVAPVAGIGRHVAGPRGLDQFCTRCGGWLCTQRIAGIDPIPPDRIVPFSSYPEGAVIERGLGWQAMALMGDPSCEAA